MATDLSRPGVYLEEGTFVDSTISSQSNSTALFLGVAPKGSTTAPIRCESWSDYVTNFGSFDNVTDNNLVSYKSYLPYAVYSYFQNGGRPCYVQRVIDTSNPGTSATTTVNGAYVSTGITASDTSVPVTSVTAIPVGSIIKIDNESMTVTAVTGTVLTVTRATSGTAAVHSVGATVSLPTTTTLSGAINSTTTTSVSVTSATGIVNGSVILIGSEQLLVTNVSGTTLTVTRGYNSTTAATAASNAAVTLPTTTTLASVTTNGTSFILTAKNTGDDGNSLSYSLSKSTNAGKEFISINIYYKGNLVESFFNLTADGANGTSKLDSTINDSYTGSKYVTVSAFDATKSPTATAAQVNFTSGTNPGLKKSGSGPYVADYLTAAPIAVSAITGPILLNLTSFASIETTPKYYVPNTNAVATNSTDTTIQDRGNVFFINDSIPARGTSTVASYITSYVTDTTITGLNYTNTQGNSYVASYAPWIIIPDPSPSGSTIAVPPGGAVAGVMARVDATSGVFRAPAGIIAAISNAVGVETKFTDSQLGTINNNNVNVIRPVTGAGIAIMGARTRKIYGPDKYVSGRRTLIYIKEKLRQSTQFAIFENNDQNLWLSLISTAEQLLRPLWEQGGLKGSSAKEAYYIKCDSSINTQALIQAGEVRLDVGVALQYPAEFIVIRVTQYENGGITAEVQTSN